MTEASKMSYNSVNVLHIEKHPPNDLDCTTGSISLWEITCVIILMLYNRIMPQFSEL